MTFDIFNRYFLISSVFISLVLYQEANLLSESIDTLIKIRKSLAYIYLRFMNFMLWATPFSGKSKSQPCCRIEGWRFCNFTQFRSESCQGFLPFPTCRIFLWWKLSKINQVSTTSLMSIAENMPSVLKRINSSESTFKSKQIISGMHERKDCILPPLSSVL